MSSNFTQCCMKMNWYVYTCWVIWKLKWISIYGELYCMFMDFIVIRWSWWTIWVWLLKMNSSFSSRDYWVVMTYNRHHCTSLWENDFSESYWSISDCTFKIHTIYGGLYIIESYTVASNICIRIFKLYIWDKWIYFIISF